ncbi:DinB family protein [Pseudodesulfovibrio karagichevae]|uniref:DinB family protein n=1 Tax=Pseudodesulfovibrio karagichevae TaxID=3239305 RepID=A0ABV4JXU4_9BACT
MQSPFVSAQELVRAVLGVVRECFDGAEDRGAFLEPGQGGLLTLLQGLSATEASTPVAGASIATHALHVAFSLDVFTDWIEGVRDREYNWDSSWAVSTVGDPEWRALCRRMADQAARLREAIERNAPADLEAAWGAAGVLAHTAYHLGAVQVKADALSDGR